MGSDTHPCAAWECPRNVSVPGALCSDCQREHRKAWAEANGGRGWFRRLFS